MSASSGAYQYTPQGQKITICGKLTPGILAQPHPRSFTYSVKTAIFIQ